MRAAYLRLFASLAAKRWLWWVFILVWGATLFLLSSRSQLPGGPSFPHQDKVMHFLYFSGGGFCFALALLYARMPMKPAWLWTLWGALFGMMIGATDEYHQSFVPGRSGNDLGDLLADLSGGGAGGLLAWALVRLIRRQHSARAE